MFSILPGFAMPASLAKRAAFSARLTAFPAPAKPAAGQARITAGTGCNNFTIPANNSVQIAKDSGEDKLLCLAELHFSIHCFLLGVITCVCYWRKEKGHA